MKKSNDRDRAGEPIFFGPCSGDRTPQTGKDTVKNTYGVAKDTSKIDTARKQGIDNSAAGGTDLVSDTSKRDKNKK